MDSEGLSSAPRELLNRLIREGEIFDDVLYEFGRTGETKRRVSLVEIRQWYEESRKLADSLGRTLPDPAGAHSALPEDREGPDRSSSCGIQLFQHPQGSDRQTPP